MKTEQEIKDKISEYMKLAVQALKDDIMSNEKYQSNMASYGAAIGALEWVLKDEK